jgi:hypothetical protein
VTSTLAAYAAGSWRERGLGDIVVPGRVVRVAIPRMMCIATLLARGQVTSHVSNQSLSKASPPSPGILATHRLDKRELSAPRLGRFDPIFLLSFRFRFHLRNEIPEFQGGSKIEVRVCIPSWVAMARGLFRGSERGSR